MFGALNQIGFHFSRRARALVVVAVSSVAALSGVAEELELSECPSEVQSTIRENLRGGKVDDIERFRIEGHTLYIVEVDIEGFRDLKLHISGSGALRKSVEEIRFRELPRPVREALEGYRKLLGGSVDDVEKVTVEEETRYHVEIEQRGEPDRHVVFEADGSVASSK